MLIGRCCVALLCLFPIAPAGAQTASTGPAAAEIVVTGENEKKSDWKRAEAEHVVVTSKGSVAELTRVTQNLERLYHLMARLFLQGREPDDPVKLQVTLFDSPNFFRAMDLGHQQFEEGPFPAIFSGRRYYDPREDGEVLAVTRADQIVDLDTTLAHNKDCDDILAGGGIDCRNTPYHPPLARSWETVLYSAFAQRFILSHVPAAYPRWYIDGIGALFSTTDMRRDGSIDYARALTGYQGVFRSYGELKVADVLTGRYLADAPGKQNWTPYHAWLLAHFFLFSNLKPERSRQFSQYMAAIRQGTPMADAARVFGDMRRLQREVNIYASNSTYFARAEPPLAPEETPLISTLSVSSAAVIEAKIELGARLANASASAADMTPAEGQRRADWLARVRQKVAQLPYDADAMLVAAEAECRSGQYTECLADAEQVLARSPDDVRALAWKGVALTDRAIAGPAADRPAGLAAARRVIERASQLDGQAPLPLIAYFQSFTKAGEPVPEQAMIGMAKVIRYVPAAPAPRLYLGEELVRRGKADLARRLLYPVLYGADDSPEKRVASALFAPAGGASPVERQGK